MTAHELRRLIEVESRVEFWGKKYRRKPLLIDRIFGDGKQLVGIQPLNTRPNYYVIRIDSGWDLSNWSDGDLFSDHLDEVLDAVEDQFPVIEAERSRPIGGGVPEERADLAYYPKELGWPAIDLGSGVHWFELKWPN